MKPLHYRLMSFEDNFPTRVEEISVEDSPAENESPFGHQTTSETVPILEAEVLESVESSLSEIYTVDQVKEICANIEETWPGFLDLLAKETSHE